VLKLAGKPLKDDTVTMSNEFLAEIMEINEKVTEITTKEEAKVICHDNCAKIDKLMVNLSAQLKSNDWAGAQRTLAEMKYFTNISEKLKEIKQSLEIGAMENK